MARELQPSSAMYATLKSLGISYHDAAQILIDGKATLNGRTMASLIADKPQLSRRIVHTAPGKLPQSCFCDWHTSVPALASRVIERYAVRHCKGNVEFAMKRMLKIELASGHKSMRAALGTALGAPAYREAIARIKRAKLEAPTTLITLHLMALVVAGCTGDGHEALRMVVAYMVCELKIETDTATAVVTRPLRSERMADSPALGFGIVRIEGGKIKAGSAFHRIGPEGCIIGLLGDAQTNVTDVDHDASIRHARVWQEDGSLFIVDLNSTNGTIVISGNTGDQILVAPPATMRGDVFLSQAVKLHYSDIICIGATTRYMVLPDIAPE